MHKINHVVEIIMKQTKGENMNTDQTCSVCFRTVKTKNNRIWDHGYKNHGIRIGNCFGANKLSFEVSKEEAFKKLKDFQFDYHSGHHESYGDIDAQWSYETGNFANAEVVYEEDY